MSYYNERSGRGGWRGRGGRGGGRSRGGWRGRSRSRGRRGRGGGRRNDYRISERSRRQLENVQVNEILTNFLKIEVHQDSVICLSRGKICNGWKLKNFHGERILYQKLEEAIKTRFQQHENDIIVRELSVISYKFIKEFNGMRVNVRIPHHHVFRDLRKRTNYDSEDEGESSDSEEMQEEEEEEVGEGDRMIRLTILYETESLVPRDKDSTTLMMVYSDIVKHFVERGNIFREDYKIFHDRYIAKRPFESSRQMRKNSIKDYFLEKEIHKAFSVGVTKREGGWFLVIKPSFRIEKIYPNGLFLIDKYIELQYSNDFIMKEFSKFKIRKLVHRNLTNELKIERLNFDMRAGDRIDFEAKQGSSDQSFINYLFQDERYRRKIQRMTRLEENEIERKQPLFVVSNNNRKEKFIPQLTEVNCCLNDENSYLQPFITSVTNKGGLRQSLDRITEIIDFFRTEGIDKDLKRFGLNVSFNRSLEKVRPKMVREVRVNDQDGNRIHSTRQSFKWQHKMKQVNIGKTSGAQEISFEYVLFYYHVGVKESAQLLFEQIVQNCNDRNIVFDQNTLYECTYDDDTKDGDWRNHVDDFWKKFDRFPKIIVVVTSLYRNDDQLYSDLVSFSIENGIAEQFCRGITAKSKNERMIGLNLFLQLYCKLGGFLWQLDFESRSFFPKESETLIIGISCLRQPQKKYFVYEDIIDDDDDDGSRRRRRDGPRRRRTKRIQKVYPTIFSAVAVCARVEWTRRITFLLPFSDQEISGSAVKRSMNYFLGEWQRDFGQVRLGTVVIYRDGLPHTKFEKAKKVEIKVLESVLSTRKIKFVYCVVQKRLNAIFFNHEADNPPCGSIVDSSVTFSDEVRKSFYISMDFFLVSYESSIHSTRPCHFVLLHDDVHQEEEFKQLCFEACAMYFNFPGCIKLPFALQMSDKLGKKCSRTLFYRDERDQTLKLNVRFQVIHTHSEKSSLEEGVIYKGNEFENESFVRVMFHETSNEGMFEL